LQDKIGKLETFWTKIGKFENVLEKNWRKNCKKSKVGTKNYGKFNKILEKFGKKKFGMKKFGINLEKNWQKRLWKIA